MRSKDWVFLLGGVSAGLLTYGALYESNRLVVERRTIQLPNWPERLRGFTLAVMGDFHLRDRYSVALTQRAIAEVLEAKPDMVALVGDFVGYWKPESARMIGEVLEPLLLMDGNVVAVPGNHDYWHGDPDLLEPILDELNIRFLRNSHWRHQGIDWIGIDSANIGRHNPARAAEGIGEGPRVVLWHEPDPVDLLPFKADLQVSGHSHGGQWKFPGWTPMHTRNGVKYEQGFFARDGKPSLYVTRGVGTTGPPARFLCPPEVALLTLVPGDRPAVIQSSRTPAAPL